MNQILSENLLKDFPDILKHAYPCCGDGWEPIIRKCCEGLQAERIKFLVENTIDDFNDTCGMASQIKEKFGTLRFYLCSGTDEMHTITEEAEFQSKTICEDCGAVGKLRSGSWYRTTCDKCHGG